jgi:hypothetical protein
VVLMICPIDLSSYMCSYAKVRYACPAAWEKIRRSGRTSEVALCSHLVVPRKSRLFRISTMSQGNAQKVLIVPDYALLSTALALCVSDTIFT